MNKTKIDWCDMSWNPVTGCRHNCEYCYARKIARRFAGGGYGKEMGMFIAKYKEEIFQPPYELSEPQLAKTKDEWYREAPYPFGFEPTFHRYRLDEPKQKTKPRNIFVCSMADLFGDWVPDKWIQDVFAACEAAPQHRYIFLTKNTDRYEKIINNGIITVRDNYWFGTSATNTEGVVYRRGQGMNTFVSIEPFLSEFRKCKDTDLLPNWVIIGAETGNRKEKVIPQRAWIESIVEDCRAAGIPVFMKSSLTDIWGAPLIQEFPWGDAHD